MGMVGNGVLRVLLVEDDDGAARLVDELLEEGTRGTYAVERATTVAGAEARLRSGRYDAFVMDVRLPDGDGIDLLARARAAGVATPALVLTALGSEYTAARALRAGANDYLSKDAAFAGDGLDHALSGMLARHRGAAAQRRAEDDLLRLTRRLRLLLELATEIGPSLKLGTPLDGALRILVEALPDTDTAAVLLYDADADVLVPSAFAGLGEAYGRLRLKPGEAISGIAFARGVVVRSDGGEDARAMRETIRPENLALVTEACGGRLFSHSVSVPLRTREGQHGEGVGQPVGVLTLGSNRADYTDDDLRVLEGVSAQLAVALDNARLYGRVRRQADELAAALDELKRAQAGLVQQERLRALGQLAAGVAHDLNNTLAPVVGFSELLRAHEASLTRQQRDWLALIHTGALDAADVVRRLREFYRPRDEMDVFGPVDAGEVVTQTVELTRPRWKDDAQAQGRTIMVTTEVPADLPPVLGSAPELREAVMNLIFNAVDALPRGGAVTVRARWESGAVVLEVADTGTGMDEATRRRCLEPFFTTKGERGTGLGLAMVHGTAQRHGGTLEIDSVPGRGTTVRMRLPASAAPEETGVAAGEVNGATGRRLRVLVVDDEPVVRAVVAALLEADGHAVVQAADGHAALAALRAAAFDALVTDRAMPGGMNGEQLAQEAKRLRAELPVVLLTGYGHLMASAGERPAGVDSVLAKPVTRAALHGALAAVAPA